MAVELLSSELQALNIREIEVAELEHLPFYPLENKLWLRERLNKIPRYLFRISTLYSDGTTDTLWVKSKDARHERASARDDILATVDNFKVTWMLYRHLLWKGGVNDAENFVSWTSSLLLALQYVFYRHKHSWDGSGLAQKCHLPLSRSCHHHLLPPLHHRDQRVSSLPYRQMRVI